MAGGCLVLWWLMLACASIQSSAMWTPLCKHCHCGESLRSVKPRSVAIFVICSSDQKEAWSGITGLWYCLTVFKDFNGHEIELRISIDIMLLILDTFSLCVVFFQYKKGTSLSLFYNLLSCLTHEFLCNRSPLSKAQWGEAISLNILNVTETQRRSALGPADQSSAPRSLFHPKCWAHSQR